MRNTLLYYLSVFLPLVALFGLNKITAINAYIFIAALLAYVFVYRTYIDGLRLYQKGVISKKEIWKMVIPGKRLQHLRALYLD